MRAVQPPLGVVRVAKVVDGVDQRTPCRAKGPDELTEVSGVRASKPKWRWKTSKSSAWARTQPASRAGAASAGNQQADQSRPW